MAREGPHKEQTGPRDSKTGPAGKLGQRSRRTPGRHASRAPLGAKVKRRSMQCILGSPLCSTNTFKLQNNRFAGFPGSCHGDATWPESRRGRRPGSSWWINRSDDWGRAKVQTLRVIQACRRGGRCKQLLKVISHFHKKPQKYGNKGPKPETDITGRRITTLPTQRSPADTRDTRQRRHAAATAGSAAASSESEPEGPLAQLKVEEPAVGEAEGGAGGFGEVGRQHGHGAVPPPGAAAKLPDVVEVCSCKHKASHAAATGETVALGPTCVQVSHHVDVPSDGQGAVDEGRAGLDAKVLVIEDHPPATSEQ